MRIKGKLDRNKRKFKEHQMKLKRLQMKRRNEANLNINFSGSNFGNITILTGFKSEEQKKNNLFWERIKEVFKLVAAAVPALLKIFS
jgi:hypothetical protein